MQSQFTELAEKVLAVAERLAKRNKQRYVGTEYLLLALIKEKDSIASKVLIQNKVKEGQINEFVKNLQIELEEDSSSQYYGFSPRSEKIIEEAHVQANRFRMKKTGTEHILLALIKEGENDAVRMLHTLGVSLQKLYIDLLVAIGQDPSLVKEDLRRKKDNKKSIPSTLAQYSKDLTALAREGRLDPVIGRENEVARVIQILSRRTKNNPCLVGEPGVGKTAVVEGIAQRIVTADVPLAIQNKRVVTLDLSSMVAGSKYRGEFEERIKKVIKEVVEDKNIILFLDELHTIIGAGGAEGAIDAANMLKPALARGEIQLIGATTIAEYSKYIEKDAALERRFQPVTVEEPTEEESLQILEGISFKYEEHHNVRIEQSALIAAIKLSSRYINDRNLPDKAIDLIDEAAAAARLSYSVKPIMIREQLNEIKELESEMELALQALEFEKVKTLKGEIEEKNRKYTKLIFKNQKNGQKDNYIITENDIAKMVSVWTKIPLQKLEEKESERLLRLEKVLHQRVIGQDEAVVAVAKAIRRGRVGLKDPNRPIGSFLFLGPTGVGKTELSKALAEVMFGTENSIVRVDMSEYMEGHSVAKMIGSPPGYVGFESGGQLCEKIRRHPYSVVLFDEIEKAHQDVFNVLLQVLDDGHITDSKGRKVSFKNTIVIMTSNAGAQKIVEPKNLGFMTETSEEKDYQRMRAGVMEEVKKLFKPEFINRIDEIMVFHPLNKQNMKEIVQLLSVQLRDRCEKQMDIKLQFTPALKEYLVDEHADLKMGARPLKRAIQSVVEDALAEEILLQKIATGDSVSVGYKNGKVVFNKK